MAVLSSTTPGHVSHQRLLITGGSGLLALNWACCMRDQHEIFLAQHVRRIRLRETRVVSLDLDSVETMLRQLEAYRPDLIIHTAGMTSVDQCEREPEKAHAANAVLARNVAEAAARTGVPLIHISTDHLFAGTRSFYREDERPEPLNVYAGTKLLAEQWVQAACARALIIRTNFFGWGHRLRQSLSDWILGTLAAAQPLDVFDDAHFTPILADRLAAAAQQLSATGSTGIYHVVGNDRVSKYEFAARLARCFALPERLIRHARISATHLPARRPVDMSLDNTKASAALGISLGTLDEYFEALKHQQQAGRQTELLDAISEP